MKIQEIIDILDKEFDVKNVKDYWNFMFDDLFNSKVEESFVTGSQTGLVIKSGEEINKIYTAFAPSNGVLKEIQKKGIVGSLLIVKHPMDWNGSFKGTAFIHLTSEDFKIMEDMQISLYSLHTPMDKNRNDLVVSTAYGFAKIIGLEVEQEFAQESDNNPQIELGLIGNVKEKTIQDLKDSISKKINYNVKCFEFGDDLSSEIKKVAVVTGGGFVPKIIQEAKNLGVNVYVTGVITPNSSEYSKENYPNEFKQVENVGVTILGCSHYLTEKHAMEMSIPYFSTICKSEFVEDPDYKSKLE